MDGFVVLWNMNAVCISITRAPDEVFKMAPPVNVPYLIRDSRFTLHFNSFGYLEVLKV